MTLKIRMENKNISIFIAFILAFIGAVTLIVIKKINSKELSNIWILVPLIINIVSVFLILIGLKYSSITIFNIEWNLISNILVTGLGILFLNEVHSTYEVIGLVFAFVSIFILNIEHIQKIYKSRE